MFFKKKKKTSNWQKDVSKQEELEDILEERSKYNKKIDNVPDEIIAKAIKDLLSKNKI